MIQESQEALTRFHRGGERAAVAIQYDPGLSDERPYPEASVNRVFSSFMFHQLQADEKEKTLREVRRVLKFGGFLHLLDFGAPEASPDGFLACWLHSIHRLRDNGEGRLLTLMRQAGLADPKEADRRTMRFLRIAYCQASVRVTDAPAAYAAPAVARPALA
jgi:ubiquinone/menaquinone biosynthesis C-methylase UbiE